MKSFEEELSALVSKHNKGRSIGTTTYALTEYILDSIKAYEHAIIRAEITPGECFDELQAWLNKPAKVIGAIKRLFKLPDLFNKRNRT